MVRIIPAHNQPIESREWANYHDRALNEIDQTISILDTNNQAVNQQQNSSLSLVNSQVSSLAALKLSVNSISLSKVDTYTFTGDIEYKAFDAIYDPTLTIVNTTGKILVTVSGTGQVYTTVGAAPYWGSAILSADIAEYATVGTPGADVITNLGVSYRFYSDANAITAATQFAGSSQIVFLNVPLGTVTMRFRRGASDDLSAHTVEVTTNTRFISAQVIQ